MQTFNTIMAVVVVLGVIYGLIRRWETRLVLIVGGLVMAVLSLNPMMAFHQFDKSMTNPNLIIAICSAMGFAAVVKLTGCDVHLVAMLTKPLKKIGILLLPACGLVTALVAIALPSTAGCAAAVAPTLIPLLIRAGFKPAGAAAMVVGGIPATAFLNPGISHNAFISKMAGMDVMGLVGFHAPRTVTLGLVAIALITVMCIIYKDYNKHATAEEIEANLALGGPGGNAPLPEHVNVFKAIAPLLPVIILVVGSIWFKSLKMSVATAMLLGTIYCFAVTRANPAEISRKFFDGMGSGYAKIMGIIIAAGVFAAGLRAAGVVDGCACTKPDARRRIGGLLGRRGAIVLCFEEPVVAVCVLGVRVPGGCGRGVAVLVGHDHVRLAGRLGCDLEGDVREALHALAVHLHEVEVSADDALGCALRRKALDVGLLA